MINDDGTIEQAIFKYQFGIGKRKFNMAMDQHAWQFIIYFLVISTSRPSNWGH